MFKVIYTVIHNAGTSTAIAMNKSPKQAFRLAKGQALDLFGRSSATNYGDSWIRMTDPYSKVIYNDLAQ